MEFQYENKMLERCLFVWELPIYSLNMELKTEFEYLNNFILSFKTVTTLKHSNHI